MADVISFDIAANQLHSTSIGPSQMKLQQVSKENGKKRKTNCDDKLAKVPLLSINFGVLSPLSYKVMMAPAFFSEK